MARPGEDEPALAFVSAAEWERWLERWHRRSDGIWMAIAKAGAATASVSYSEALDVALCFGWIDGQKAAPRRSRLAAALHAAAATQPLVAEQPAAHRGADSGRQDARRGRRRGRARQGRRPLGRRLPRPPHRDRARRPAAGARRQPRARASSSPTLDRANRYAILWRIHDARRPQTRAERIARFVEMLAAREKLHP